MSLLERIGKLHLAQRLAGADPDIVAKFPAEGRRFTGIGSAIMFTGGFAAVAGLVFLHDFLHVWLPLALVLALLWGVGIMALDRWLIISMRRQGSWWKTLLMALPRLFLSFLVGLVIAEPVVLRVFQTEVRQEAGDLRQQHYKNALADINRSYADIEQNEGRQKDLQSSLAPDKGAILQRNEEYQRLVTSYTTLNGQLTRLRASIQCQLRHTCRSTPGSLRNAQNLALIVRGKVQAAKRDMKTLRRDLLKKEAQAFGAQTATTRTQLRQLAIDIKARQEERAVARAHAKRDYRQPIGLMDRVEALNALASDRPGTFFFTWILRLLIFFIDFIPVLFKTVTLFCKPTAAEREEEDREETTLEKLAHERHKEVDRAKKLTDAALQHELTLQRLDQQVKELAAELSVTQAKTNNASVAENTEELQRLILAAQMDVGKAVVERWHEKARGSVDRLVDEYVDPAPPPHGNGNGPQNGGGAHAPSGAGAPYERKFDRTPAPPRSGSAGPQFVQHPPSGGGKVDGHDSQPESPACP